MNVPRVRPPALAPPIPCCENGSSKAHLPVHRTPGTRLGLHPVERVIMARLPEVQMHDATRLTIHARERSRNRGIPDAAIDAAIELGMHRAIRGADIYTLGWRQVRFHAQAGIDLSRWEGIEVVCAHDGQILTVYRNKNPRALRDRASRHRAA